MRTEVAFLTLVLLAASANGDDVVRWQNHRSLSGDRQSSTTIIIEEEEAITDNALQQVGARRVQSVTAPSFPSFSPAPSSRTPTTGGSGTPPPIDVSSNPPQLAAPIAVPETDAPTPGEFLNLATTSPVMPINPAQLNPPGAPPTTSSMPSTFPSYPPFTDPLTSSPTPDPTSFPPIPFVTSMPTDAPVLEPTTDEPISSPPTDKPIATSTPTMKPTIGTPTSSPTPIPSTGFPSPYPTTLPPSVNPTISPTLPKGTTASPTISAPPTIPPTLKEQSTGKIRGLSVTLYGISAIESTNEWELTTADFYNFVYNDVQPGGMTDVDVKLEITNVEDWKVERRRRRGRRGLQNNNEVAIVISYNQKTFYRSANPNYKPNEDLVLLPLSSSSFRAKYVDRLKELNGYEDLTEVSEISSSSNKPPPPSPSSNDGLGTGAIVGISIGVVVLVFAMIIAGITQYNKKHYTDKPLPNTVEYNPNTQNTGRGDESLSVSVPTGPSSGVNSFSYNDQQTVQTTDYDYNAAYGGAGADFSVSNAEGTLGSRTRQTGADSVSFLGASGTSAIGGGLVPGSGGNTVFSEDPTFDQVYDDVREILIDVYAPAGKLGVVIDTPNDGAPVIHAVKETSPIVDKVFVGDKLVAVDDEDVRAMTAMKVSKLISRKGNQASRKLTIIRHERKA